MKKKKKKEGRLYKKSRIKSHERASSSESLIRLLRFVCFLFVCFINFESVGSSTGGLGF